MSDIMGKNLLPQSSKRLTSIVHILSPEGREWP